MTWLWGIILATALGVCIALIWPLLRQTKTNMPPFNRKEYELHVYREQLKKIAQDYQEGLLTIDNAEIAQAEIHHKILQTDKLFTSQPTHKILDRQAKSFLSISIVLFCFLGSVISYLQLGSPNLPGYNTTQIQNPVKASSQSNNDTTNALRKKISGLLKDLDNNPNNIDHWVLLGDTLIAAGQYDGAEEAYQRAYKLDSSDKEIGADYAEARILNNMGRVDQYTVSLLTSLLSESPRLPKALFYLGLGKAQSGKYGDALQHWVDVRALSPRSAPWLPMLQRQIDKISKKSGINPDSIKPSISSATDTSNLTPLPKLDLEQKEIISGMSEEAKLRMIYDMVKGLSERLKNNPDDLEGWARLIKSYQVLGEREKADYARQQYKKALKKLKP